jgi:hypothetical protein
MARTGEIALGAAEWASPDGSKFVSAAIAAEGDLTR